MARSLLKHDPHNPILRSHLLPLSVIHLLEAEKFATAQHSSDRTRLPPASAANTQSQLLYDTPWLKPKAESPGQGPAPLKDSDGSQIGGIQAVEPGATKISSVANVGNSNDAQMDTSQMKVATQESHYIDGSNLNSKGPKHGSMQQPFSPKAARREASKREPYEEVDETFLEAIGNVERSLRMRSDRELSESDASVDAMHIPRLPHSHTATAGERSEPTRRSWRRKQDAENAKSESNTVPRSADRSGRNPRRARAVATAVGEGTGTAGEDYPRRARAVGEGTRTVGDGNSRRARVVGEAQIRSMNVHSHVPHSLARQQGTLQHEQDDHNVVVNVSTLRVDAEDFQAAATRTPETQSGPFSVSSTSQCEAPQPMSMHRGLSEAAHWETWGAPYSLHSSYRSLASSKANVWTDEFCVDAHSSHVPMAGASEMSESSSRSSSGSVGIQRFWEHAEQQLQQLAGSLRW